jgi:aspartyl-tRNA(Asn)/glutamyl-tRNA(Gln) amidotransferase subunit C
MQIDNTVLAKLEEVMEQLTGILDYVDNLNELDTEALDASFSTLDGGTPLREDRPREANDIAKDILSHAPQAKDDFFIVPAIIE